MVLFYDRNLNVLRQGIMKLFQIAEPGLSRWTKEQIYFTVMVGSSIISCLGEFSNYLYQLIIVSQFSCF